VKGHSLLPEIPHWFLNTVIHSKLTQIYVFKDTDYRHFKKSDCFLQSKSLHIGQYEILPRFVKIIHLDLDLVTCTFFKQLLSQAQRIMVNISDFKIQWSLNYPNSVNPDKVLPLVIY